jgi:hypothetical protein
VHHQARINVNLYCMKKLCLTPFLLLLLYQVTFSQTKEIKGDTAYWYKRDIKIQKTLGLKDFEKSANEFNFRFRNQGQVVEISSDSSKITGSIVSYIYHSKNSNSSNFDTLTKKIILSPKQAKVVYNIVQTSRILNIPSDREIENWLHGSDGITYIIEHSNKNTFWLKSYWTPSTQNSIPEAKIVLDLVKKLSDTLSLEMSYNAFKNKLPKIGCYNSGGMSQICYLSNVLELGYSGASKLPLGFYSSYSATYLGKTKINAGTSLQYNYNRKGFHHLNFQIHKGSLFYKKADFYDFISYNYQNRKVDLNNAINKFKNHQIKYGLNYKKNISFALGVDYVERGYYKTGVHIFAGKWFSKPNLSSIFTTSIFNKQVNYKTEIFKSFDLNYKVHPRRLSLGLVYEDFMDYEDFYFNVRFII